MVRTLPKRLTKELNAMRQMAQEVLDLLSFPRVDAPVVPRSPSLGAPTLSTYCTARDQFDDQESAICVEDQFVLKPNEPVDFVHRAPPELLLMILSFMDLRDIICCFSVSRSWFQILNSQPVWRLLYQRQFASKSKDCTCSYKALYKNHRTLQANWRSSWPKTRTLTGHQDSVYCAQILDNWIFTGSRDNTMRVWDLTTSECIRVLEQHTASVLCLAADSKILVSGSSDTSVLVYSLPTFELLYTLRGHSAHVFDVHLTNDYIVSCSKDWSLAAWHRSTGKLAWKVPRAHQAAVNAMDVLDDMLFTAGGDGVLRQWDIHTGQITRKFRGHSRGLACVLVDAAQNRIITGGNDRSVRVWDLDTGECTMALMGHQHLVRSLHLLGTNIVSASYDRTIRVWNSAGECVAQHQGLHGSWIFCVSGNSKHIVSTSAGTKPVILDYTHGVDHQVMNCIQ